MNITARGDPDVLAALEYAGAFALTYLEPLYISPYLKDGCTQSDAQVRDMLLQKAMMPTSICEATRRALPPFLAASRTLSIEKGRSSPYEMLTQENGAFGRKRSTILLQRSAAATLPTPTEGLLCLRYPSLLLSPRVLRSEAACQACQ